MKDAMTNAAAEPNLRDLILALDKKIDALDKKIDVQNAEIKQVKTELTGEIKQVKTELTGEIKQVKIELAGEISQVRTELKGEIALAGAETKRLEEKIEGFGKRIDQQEFINRGAILALIAGVATGFIKYLFFNA